MKSIHEFLAEAKAAPAKKVVPAKKAAPAKNVKKPTKDTTSSSRIKCVQAVVENLKKALPAGYSMSLQVIPSTYNGPEELLMPL
jgi:hypothetical protein